jgi:hypothetical protein
VGWRYKLDHILTTQLLILFELRLIIIKINDFFVIEKRNKKLTAKNVDLKINYELLDTFQFYSNSGMN